MNSRTVKKCFLIFYQSQDCEVHKNMVTFYQNDVMLRATPDYHKEKYDVCYVSTFKGDKCLNNICVSDAFMHFFHKMTEKCFRIAKYMLSVELQMQSFNS